ncbi:MAG: hypothetical protein EOO75_11590 [Myxococcales bacterium]|nr:MAG: hypothetical protein EOO75_11590 [Myxococcales bacterium]
MEESPFDSSPGLPFEPTPAMAAARVTMPDEVPTSAPRVIPLEGERGASTLITRSGRPPRRTLVIGGVVGAVVLVALGGALVHRSTGDTAATASASASSAPAPEPPPVPTPTVVAVIPEVPALPELGPKQGALRVKTTAPGNVYVNGALAGATDKVLVVNCGQRYIRVGAASPVRGRTLWLGPGVSVKVACGVLTEVDAPQAR